MATPERNSEASSPGKRSERCARYLPVGRNDLIRKGHDKKWKSALLHFTYRFPSGYTTVMQRNIYRCLICVIAALTLFVSGCASPDQKPREARQPVAMAAPEPGKSMVVFLRPSKLGWAVQSTLYDVKDNKAEIIGIISGRQKAACQVEPGEHLLMVMGESTDFMSANLLPDKTYYAIVEPRMGMWKARFSMRPVHAQETDSNQFAKWLRACRVVERVPRWDSWALEHATAIESRRAEYYPEWTAKPESERPRLLSEDGR